MHLRLTMGAALLGLTALASTAHANLVTNGGFASSTYTANTEFGTAYSQTTQQGVDGWTGNNGYDIFFTNAATSTVQNTAGQYSGTGVEKLWGPITASPGGGSFIGLDGDQTSGVQGMVSQTINGLVSGQQYQLSFDWAGAQVQSRTGATTDSLNVSLGSQSYTTATVSNASQGFTGWMNQVFTFTATGTSELLSFLSVGTPVGLPPMALLDDVSLNQITTAVPEPMSLALLGTGLIGLIGLRRRRAA